MSWPALALMSLAVPVVMIAAGVPPARPLTLTPAQRESVIKEIETDRADTEQWLKSDISSYLATVDRRDFEQKKTLTVGRSAGNDVRVDDPAFTAHHLRISVEGDQFRVEAIDPAARFTADKKETRAAVLKPSAIGVGRFQLGLSHQRYPAIIVFDP